jgi:hypothetical protein
VVAHHFGRHRDAEIYASQPGLGVILGARVLAEFGDDRTASPMPRHARTTPAPHRSPEPRDKKKLVLARYARNERLGDAIQQWAFGSLKGSPGARAYYDTLEPAKSATKQHYDNSATGSSASCTAA